MTLLILGLLGAYSYGEAYYQHRGFTTVPQLPRAGTGRLLDVHFYSPALRRKADYLVYLPPGYSSSRRYPVYYLLHGMPGRPQVFVDIANIDVRLDNQLSEGHVRPMILVYPDGRIGGSVYSDSEWANTPSGDYDSYVIDVIQDVDHRFSTLADRTDRVIAGFSAGAYGAINIALHHLGYFASVQVWSGYFTETRSGVFAHASRATLAYDSPIDRVTALRRELAVDPLRVFMFAGRDDEASSQIVPMVDALRANGATAHYAIYAGGHDWSVWYPRLNQMLILASEFMLRPSSSSGATVRRQARSALLARHRRPRVRHHEAKATFRRHRGPHVRRPHVRRPHVRRPHVRRPHVRRRHVRRQVLVGTNVHPLAAFSPALAAGTSQQPRLSPRHNKPLLIGALLLALVSAAMINLGFVLQHRGLSRLRGRGRIRATSVLGSRSWLAGQALGWLGFVTQIVAVAIAPLSMVQAFAAGGLAISVPLAARIFGHRVTRRQLLAVLGMAAALFSLPIGFDGAHGHLHSGLLIGVALITLSVAVVIALPAWPASRSIAAGVFYGVADAAIKADSIGLRAHGAGALLSGWTVLAILATFGGFLSFQAALRDDHAVNAISLMNASVALAALSLGVLAFGESLGTNPAATAVHLLAIGVVLACVPPLARKQQQLSEGGRAPQPAPDVRSPGGAWSFGGAWSLRRTLVMASGAVAIGPALLLCTLTGLGLLYAQRGLQWFAIGPPIPDSLPLLQLAGFDGQPVARVILAWLAAGVIIGFALIRLGPLQRSVLVGLLGVLILLLASDASYALARNVRLEGVLLDRAPGLGPWLEGVLLAVGSALPRRAVVLSRLGRLRLPTAISQPGISR
jgi:enterochelin esterase-like enzyme